VAETAAEKAHSSSGPLLDPTGLSTYNVIQVSESVEEAGNAAMTACSACADFLVNKRADLEALGFQSPDVQMKLNLIQPRIQDATRKCAEALQRAKMSKY